MYIGKYPDWYKYSFGGEEHIQKLAEIMAKRGHEVNLVNCIYEGESSGVKYNKLNYAQMPLVQRIEGKPFPLYPKSNELKNLVNQVKPDIIHHFAKCGYSTEQLRKKGAIEIPTLNSIIVSRSAQTGHSYPGLFVYSPGPSSTFLARV